MADDYLSADLAVSLTELLATDFGPEKWRIDGLWPAGGSVALIATMKAGKSTIVANVLRALVDGAELFGYYRAVPLDEGRTVVVLDLELSPRQLKQWSGRLGIVNTDAVRFLPLRGKARRLNLLDEDGVSELAEVLAELRAQVVILDPLRPLVDVWMLSENNDLSVLFEGLKDACTRAGVDEFMMVHHAGNAAEGLEADEIRARGDSGLAGGVDTIWRHARTRDARRGERRFVAFGREVDTSCWLSYDKATGCYLVSGVVEQHADDQAAEWVALVRRLGTPTAADVCMARHGHRVMNGAEGKAVVRKLDTLAKDGKLAKDTALKRYAAR